MYIPGTKSKFKYRLFYLKYFDKSLKYSIFALNSKGYFPSYPGIYYLI